MPLRINKARLLTKRSVISGLTPVLTTGSTTFTQGNWDTNEIMNSEFFWNSTDEKLWIGNNSGVTELITSTSIEEYLTGTTIPNHNDLSGLQGGQLDEYYHLSESQYNNLTATTSPGGLNSNVQFNNGGEFGGDSGFIYDQHGINVQIGGNVFGVGTNYSLQSGLDNLITNSNQSAILGGENNRLIGADNSVVIGGENITGTTSNTVYVQKLNIKDLSTNDTEELLGVDLSGNVTNATSFTTLQKVLNNGRTATLTGPGSPTQIIGTNLGTQFINTDGNNNTSQINCGSPFQAQLLLESLTGGTSSIIEVNSNSPTLRRTVSAGTAEYEMKFAENQGGMVVKDTIDNRGLLYQSNYSTNYTDRSLVDKEYVDSKLTGVCTPIYWTSGSSGNYSLKVINDSSVDATANYALAEGGNTLASGQYSHAEGSYSIASGFASHAEGDTTLASGQYSHAGGNATSAITSYTRATGRQTLASGLYANANGRQTVASGELAVTYGYQTLASGTFSFATGNANQSLGESSFSIGQSNTAETQYTFVTGLSNLVRGSGSAIIGSENSVINENVNRSVILGGTFMTATTEDTVYVDKLNIKTITGTSSTLLGIDSDGNVVTGTGGGGAFRVRAESADWIDDEVTFKEGTNVTLSQSGTQITINASGGGGESLIRMYHRGFGENNVQLGSWSDTNPLLFDKYGNATSNNGGYQQAFTNYRGAEFMVNDFTNITVRGSLRPANFTGSVKSSGTEITFTLHIVETTATSRTVLETKTFTVTTLQNLNNNQGQEANNPSFFSLVMPINSSIANRWIGYSVTTPTIWGVRGDVNLTIKLT